MGSEVVSKSFEIRIDRQLLVYRDSGSLDNYAILLELTHFNELFVSARSHDETVLNIQVRMCQGSWRTCLACAGTVGSKTFYT